MKPVRRGHQLLLAQIPNKGWPELREPDDLPPDALAIWRELVGASRAALTDADRGSLEVLAYGIANWRRTWVAPPQEPGLPPMNMLRFTYRWLGNFFLPMAARRTLLFGDSVRPSRSKRV